METEIVAKIPKPALEIMPNIPRKCQNIAEKGFPHKDITKNLRASLKHVGASLKM
jgi:hypothetical protein